MRRARADMRLERLLMALGVELAEASDEEVLAAATDLGLKPMMKGTVAYVGLKHVLAPYDPEKFPAPDNEWTLGESESEPPSPPWKRD